MPPGDADESYFADGRVSPAAVERLFTAARGLFATASWSIAADTQVLRMDVPALDVEGACLSILGQATGRNGVLIFPSLIDFEVFMDAAGDLDDGPFDLGSGWLRREAMQHGWRCSPRTRSRRRASRTSLWKTWRYGSPYPMRGTRISICRIRWTTPMRTWSSTSHSTPNRRRPRPRPFDHGSPATPPVRAAAGASCLPAHEAAHTERQPAPAVHESDERLVARLTRFALREFGAAWTAFANDFDRTAAAARRTNAPG